MRLPDRWGLRNVIHPALHATVAQVLQASGHGAVEANGKVAPGHDHC